MGAQQSRTFAGQESTTTRTRSAAAALNGQDDAATESTGLRIALATGKPSALTSPDGLASSVSPRSNHLKQQRHSLELEPPTNLLHRRDFEVKRVRNKRDVEGRISFSVRWKSTWVPLEAIVMGNGHECSYVEAEGAPWYIRKELQARVNNGVEERKVRWASTREPLENLVNAQEAIANYETAQQQASLDGTSAVRQRRVLTFEESQFPRGMVLPQSDDDYAKSQRWVASTWPIIRPRRTLDLYPAIYRIQMELL